MTHRDVTLNNRWQVYADLKSGVTRYLVNTYKTEQGADACVRALSQPGSFVERAYVVDDLASDSVIDNHIEGRNT